MNKGEVLATTQTNSCELRIMDATEFYVLLEKIVDVIPRLSDSQKLQLIGVLKGMETKRGNGQNVNIGIGDIQNIGDGHHFFIIRSENLDKVIRSIESLGVSFRENFGEETGGRLIESIINAFFASLTKETGE